MHAAGTMRAARQTGSFRRLVTGYASYRKLEAGWRIVGAAFGVTHRVSTLFRMKTPLRTRSPGPREPSWLSNGMNGSTAGDCDVLVPLASVAWLR
jgi:hypothetical protein